MAQNLAQVNLAMAKAIPDDLEFAKDVLTGTSLLQQRAVDVRNQKINWQSYMQSQMISADEMEFITSIDHVNANQRNSILDQDPSRAARCFISLMQHISKEQTIQYILTLIDDILQEDKRRVEMFNDFANQNQTTVWGPFLHMLNRNDGFIANQASRIIAKIACWSNKQFMSGPDLTYYLTWLKDQMKNPLNEYMQTVARCLQMLMTVADYRKPFYALDGVQSIVSLLSKKINFQIQYQLVYCLWCMSFDSDLAEKISQQNVIPLLSTVLNDSGKEKVSRITIGTLRHLLENPKSGDIRQANAVSMIRCKVFKQIQLIQNTKGGAQSAVGDPEMLDDIQYLYDTLQGILHDLSSFDEYTSELRSGVLEWSPVHKSQKFWTENIDKFSDKNFEVVKLLVTILRSNIQAQGISGPEGHKENPLSNNVNNGNTLQQTNPFLNNAYEGNPSNPITPTSNAVYDRNVVLAVACHDIGEFVRYYPPGKRIVEKLGAKQLIMSLLANRDSSVRYEALVALQKIMVHNWEYLGKQLDKENVGSALKSSAKKPENDIVSAVNAATGK